MKIATIKGGNLNKWDSLALRAIDKKEDLTVIGSTNPRYDISDIKFKKILLPRLGSLIEWSGQFATLVDYVINMNNYLIGLKKVLKKFDIVETGEQTYPFTYQAIKAHKNVVVVSVENIPYFREFGITKKFKDYARKHAKHFIAGTKRAKSVLEAEGVDSSRITVIPLSVDTKVFKPMPKDENLMKRLGLKKTDIHILFVGRLKYDKGILDVIYAMRILKKKHPNIKLLILGRGPLKKRIDELVRLFGLRKHVKYLGFLPYLETVKYYNIADIFCTPCTITKYWQEQFGFVFAEAMACEKAIVSTYSGSIPEVTAGHSILVPPGNFLALSEGLDKAISDKNLRQKLGKEARQYALNNYSPEVVAEKKLALFNQILKEK